MNAIEFVHEQLTKKPTLPAFKAGDNITVNYKIVEGNKERIQSFKGDVIKRQGTGSTATFTVRKISDGVGVERLFPVFSDQVFFYYQISRDPARLNYRLNPRFREIYRS
jgi:large subunit ribosomal protein L19